MSKYKTADGKSFTLTKPRSVWVVVQDMSVGHYRQMAVELKVNPKDHHFEDGVLYLYPKPKPIRSMAGLSLDVIGSRIIRGGGGKRKYEVGRECYSCKSAALFKLLVIAKKRLDFEAAQLSKEYGNRLRAESEYEAAVAEEKLSKVKERTRG